MAKGLSSGDRPVSRVSSTYSVKEITSNRPSLIYNTVVTLSYIEVGCQMKIIWYDALTCPGY